MLQARVESIVMCWKLGRLASAVGNSEHDCVVNCEISITCKSWQGAAQGKGAALHRIADKIFKTAELKLANLRRQQCVRAPRDVKHSLQQLMCSVAALAPCFGANDSHCDEFSHCKPYFCCGEVW